MPLPVFVISLKRATDRRADIIPRLQAAGVDFELVDAVDGAELDASEYQHRLTNDLAFARGNAGLNAGAIGIFLSHYNLWQRIVDENIPFALILEDDCVWGDDFFQLAEAITKSDCYWNIVHLSAHRRKREWFGVPVIDNIGDRHQLVQAKYPQGGCDAYLIDQDGAAKMLKHHHQIRDHVDIQWKRYWESGCYFYHLYPRIAWQNDLPSYLIHTPESRRLRYQNGWCRYQLNKLREKYQRNQFLRHHSRKLRVNPRANSKKIFLDVGGHLGETLAEVLTPDYHFDLVHCFEPQAKCYEHITVKFTADIAAGRLIVHNFGLADFDGERDLFGGESTSLGASMFADKRDIDGTESEVCQFKRASEFINVHIADGDRAVMKLNCEGGEVFILRDLIASGAYRKFDEVMVDFDIRKVPSQRHQQKKLIREMHVAGFTNYRTHRYAFCGPTYYAKLRFWITSMSNAADFTALTDKEKRMRRLPFMLRWFMVRRLNIRTIDD